MYAVHMTIRLYVVCAPYYTERVVNAGTPQEHTVQDKHVGCPLGVFPDDVRAQMFAEKCSWPAEELVIKEFDLVA